LVIALITFKQPYKAFDEKIVNLKVENFAKNHGLDKDMGILWPYWQIFVRAEQAL